MSDPTAVSPSRRGARLAAASAAAAALVASGVAEAQVDPRWQVGASVQGGITDNVAQTPDPDPDDPDAVQPQTDGLLVLSPTIALILDAESSTHTFAYGFGTTLYFQNPEANSYSNGLSWASIFQLSETVDLALGAAGTYAQTGAFNLLGGADATNVAIQPAGLVEVISVGVTQGLEVAIDENWSFNQTLGGTAIFQLDQPRRTNLLSASVGLTREFQYDTLGGNFGAELLRQPAVDPFVDDEGIENPGSPSNTQLILRLTGSWTHALSERWSTTLAAGGLLALQLGEAFDENGDPVNPPPVAQPYGLASIDFTDDFGSAGLQIQHDVSPNVLTGSAQLTDTATLRAGLPIGRETGLLFTTTGAAGMARNLDVDGTFGPRFLLFVADAGLSYALPPLPELSIDLRYQFTKQMPADPDDPEAEAAGLQSVTRNTVLLGMSITFPPAAEGGGVAAAAVFQPTPTGGSDILAGVRAARETREDEAEAEERRGRGKEDRDGKYGPGEEKEAE